MKTWVHIFVVATSSLLIGCGILGMDYVPRAENISEYHAEWLAGDSNIRGIYGNMDVDSMLFEYESNLNDSLTFWALIDDQAKSENWELIDNEENIRRYQRIIPRTGERMFHSAEETRIAYSEESHRVVVAWIQADEMNANPPDSTAETDEGRWADRNLWPQFEEQLK